MINKVLITIFFAFMSKMAVCQYIDVYRAESSMDEFHLVSEKIVPKSEQLIAMLKDRNYRIAGYKDSLLVIHRSNKYGADQRYSTVESFQVVDLVYYNEKTREIVKNEKVDTIASKSIEVKICNQSTIKFGFTLKPDKLKLLDH